MTVRWRTGLTAALAVATWAGTARADVEADLATDGVKLEPALKSAERLVAGGHWSEANAALLAVFPEKTRTATQALLLGNVLFGQDADDSYPLHERAAAQLPDEPSAQLEWALEQHRAGQFAAAADSYAKFVKANPRFGPALGMRAECLIRTGKVEEAADAWAASERGTGSLEALESWVCEVHTHTVPDRDRERLWAKATAGDAAATASLVALDCDFPRDWWNAGPAVPHLKADLAAIKAGHYADADAETVRQAKCAASCGLAVAAGGADGDDRVRPSPAPGVLKRAGFLLDEKATLPADGRLLSVMVDAVGQSHALTVEQIRDRFGQAVLDRAKATQDAATFNVAAHLYLGTDRLGDVDQLGWDLTGDRRFAASRIVGLYAAGKLTLDDPLLARAVKQFPDEANVAGVVVRLTKRAGKPLRPALVAAIEAEYTHFSVGGLLGGRPTATGLRAYFAELSKVTRAAASRP